MAVTRRAGGSLYAVGAPAGSRSRSTGSGRFVISKPMSGPEFRAYHRAEAKKALIKMDLVNTVEEKRKCLAEAEKHWNIVKISEKLWGKTQVRNPEKRIAER